MSKHLKIVPASDMTMHDTPFAVPAKGAMCLVCPHVAGEHEFLHRIGTVDMWRCKAKNFIGTQCVCGKQFEKKMVPLPAGATQADAERIMRELSRENDRDIARAKELGEE